MVVGFVGVVWTGSDVAIVSNSELAPAWRGETANGLRAGWRPWSAGLISVGYIASFLVLDWISFIHPFSPFGIKPWDPPTALTLSLLLRFGLKFGWIVPVAILCSDIFVRDLSVTALPTLVSATIVTVVHVVSALLLRHWFKIDTGLSRVIDVVRFAAVSLGATLALATAVVLQFIAASLLTPGDFSAAALRSWVGDFIGILALAPALLVYSHPRTWSLLPRGTLARLRLGVESLVQVLGILFTLWIVFDLSGAEAYKFFYLLFLPVTWMAVRQGVEGATAGILVTQVGLILALQDQGHEATTLIEFQMLMLSLCLAGLFLGAIVSERRMANRALRANEARLTALLETAPDAMFTLDSDGRIESANPAAERMFGSARDGLLNTSINRLLPQLDLRASDGLREMPGTRGDGTNFPAEVAVGEAIVDQRNVYIAAARDVTRRVDAETWVRKHQLELAHADRVSMVGAMASAIAHEESQPLAAIAAYTRACLLLLRAPGTDLAKIRNSLEKVAEQAIRAGEILNRLREFLQRGEMQVQPTDAAELVRAVAELARTDVTVHGIKLVVDLESDLPEVLADRVHIEQVALNLVRNAVDALSDHPGESREITICARQCDGRVRFIVRDTGPGIDPAVASRLFQPFTTTKGSGMGLGLSISKTIVEAHGGTLQYLPQNGPGAVFSFDLMLADE